MPLGVTASMSFTQKMRNLDSRNVVAKITGADPTLKNEYVVYTAHWDHFGVSTPVNGDAIYNGARDNATGTAMLLEFARAFKKVQPAAETHHRLCLGDRRRTGPARARSTTRSSRCIRWTRRWPTSTSTR